MGGHVCPRTRLAGEVCRARRRHETHGSVRISPVPFRSSLDRNRVSVYFGAGIFWFHSRASCKGKASVRESEAARLGKGEADAAAAFTSAFTAPYVADESKGHRSHGKGSDGTAAAFTAAFTAPYVADESKGQRSHGKAKGKDSGGTVVTDKSKGNRSHGKTKGKDSAGTVVTDKSKGKGKATAKGKAKGKGKVKPKFFEFKTWRENQGSDWHMD